VIYRRVYCPGEAHPVPMYGSLAAMASEIATVNEIFVLWPGIALRRAFDMVEVSSISSLFFSSFRHGASAGTHSNSK